MRGGEKTGGTLGERSVAGWLSDQRRGVLSINYSDRWGGGGGCS